MDTSAACALPPSRFTPLMSRSVRCFEASTLMATRCPFVPRKIETLRFFKSSRLLSVESLGVETYRLLRTPLPSRMRVFRPFERPTTAGRSPW
ncbi:hypothetical protein D3C72_1934220 [compost metagenome]